MDNFKDGEIFLQKFVRNYYEVHGSLEKIELTSFGEALRVNAQGRNTDLISYCLELIGYRSGMTLDDLVNLAKWQVSDYDYLSECGLGASCAETDEIIQSMYGKSIKRVYRPRNLNKKLATAAIMLTKYYRMRTDQKIEVDDGVFNINSYLTWLRMNYSKWSVSDYIDELQKRGFLVTFMEADSMYVTNGMFFHTGFTDKQLKKIQSEAIVNLLNGDDLVSRTIKDFGAIPFLAEKSTSTYLAILDMCKGLGITYAKYMKCFGYNVIDQIPIIKKYDAIIQKLGDNLYITKMSATLDEPYLEIPTSEIQHYLQSIGDMIFDTVNGSVDGTLNLMNQFS